MLTLIMGLGLLLSLIAIAVVLTLLLLGMTGMIHFRVKPLEDVESTMGIKVKRGSDG